MKHPHSLKKQAGLTLTESLLVLAVAALVAVLAYAGYKMANSNVKQAAAVDSAARMLSAIKKSFGASGNYPAASVTTANLGKSGIVPSEFTVAADFSSITAPWATDSTVTLAGNTTTATVTFIKVPTSVCLDLMAGIEGFTDSMQAGATGGALADVKTSTTKFDPGTAASKCGAAADIAAVIK